MAGIWFHPDNLAAKVVSTAIADSANEGMYYGGKIALQMLVYIDSSNATENVPLFSSLSNTSTPPNRFYFEVSVDNGKLRARIFDRTTQKMNVYFSELIPFDQMIEIKIIQGNPYPYIHAWVNGTKLTLESGNASKNNSIVFGYFQATLGGVIPIPFSNYEINHLNPLLAESQSQS